MKIHKVLTGLSRNTVSNSALSVGLFCFLYMPEVGGQQRTKKQFSTPPLAVLAWWSSILLGDVLSIILGPCMKSGLMWLSCKVIFAFFFSGKKP